MLTVLETKEKILAMETEKDVILNACRQILSSNSTKEITSADELIDIVENEYLPLIESPVTYLAALATLLTHALAFLDLNKEQLLKCVKDFNQTLLNSVMQLHQRIADKIKDDK